jgi:hypothetical protein
MKRLILGVCAIIGFASSQNAVMASPAADDLIRMARSGVDEEVLSAYINASPDTYDLSADDIITLKDLGVPSKVIKEALGHGAQADTSGQGLSSAQPAATASEQAPQQLVPSSAALAPAPDDQNISFFYEALYPYGNWLEIDGTWCWQPNAAIVSIDWAPYCRHGHWVYSDCGWFWNSDYSWGWAPFHYGRWFRHAVHGWCWVPDNEWAPAWVAWRWGEGYCGWAPLPPRTRFDRHGGFYFGDNPVGADFEFNLGMNDYFFVSAGHFCDPHPWVNMVPSVRLEEVYRKTAVIKGSYGVENNHLVNHGPSVAEISRAVNKQIKAVSVVSNAIKPGQPIPRNGLRENQLMVYRPTLVSTAPKTPIAVRSILEKRAQNIPHGNNAVDEKLIARRKIASEQTMKSQQMNAESSHQDESRLQKASQAEADNAKRGELEVQAKISSLHARESENRVASMKRWNATAQQQPLIIPQSRALPQQSSQNREQIQVQLRKQIVNEANIEKQRQGAAERMIREPAVKQREPEAREKNGR